MKGSKVNFAGVIVRVSYTEHFFGGGGGSAAASTNGITVAMFITMAMISPKRPNLSKRFTFGCILKESEFVPRGGPR